MRHASAVLAVSALVVSGVIFWHPFQNAASAQPGDGAVHLAEAKKGQAKKQHAAQKKAAPKEAAGNSSGMPLAERIGVQFDLAWTGHFNGLINGEFNDRSVAAVRAFQKDYKFKESGVLAPPERALLASMSKEKQGQGGWRMVDDKATGAQVGLPTKHVPNVSKSKSGTRWSSAQGQIQVETFRPREPGLTLAAVFEDPKKEPPNRKLEVNVLRDDTFILSGLQ